MKTENLNNEEMKNTNGGAMGSGTPWPWMFGNVFESGSNQSEPSTGSGDAVPTDTDATNGGDSSFGPMMNPGGSMGAM